MSERLDLDAETISDITRLLEVKAKARETGDGDRLPRIDRLIETEFEWARTSPPQKERRDLATQADHLFRAFVKAGEQ